MKRLSSKVVALVVGGAAALSAARWSGAATFNIANGDVAGLITAINTANSNNQNDDINLAANGTYTLTTVNNVNDGPNGLPTITSDSGHQINIYGNGAMITRSSSAPDFRIFFLQSGSESVALNDLVITNGESMFSGGAIENAASLSLSRCVFSHNFAIAGNSNDELGGAIYNHGSSLAVDSCTFNGNHAVKAGGAIYSARGNLVVTDSTFTGNSTLDDGGPLYGGGAIDIIGGSNPSISYSTFSQNHGGSGGAVRVEAGSSVVSMSNCTLTDNQAPASGSPSEGGAIEIDNTAGLTITSCTVIGNQARNGPDIWNQGVVTIGNSIVGRLSNNVGTVTSQGYNISESPNSLLNGPGDQVNTDPKLDPLGLRDNGGPTQTIALTYSSPAIDKGNSFGLTIDQRGVARPYDNPAIANASGGDGSDVGAYEAPQDPVQSGANFVVTTTDDHDDGLCSGTDCTLREAVVRANTVPGASSIIFARSLSGTITLTMGELIVTDSLTITGIPIGTISGNGASRIFSFTGGDSSLVGLTIRDGRNQVLLGNVTNGGGIYNSATLHLYGCLLINNRVLGANTLSPSAADGGAGQGGGIYNSSTLYLDGSTFSQTNEASGGDGGSGNSGHGGVPSGSGGVGRGGAVFNDTSGNLFITNCTFNGNVVMGGNGGSGGPLGGNGGNGEGGAICNLGEMTITSVTISGNSGSGGIPGTGDSGNGVAGSGSGGLTVAGGSKTTVGNTISAGNTGGAGADVNGAFTSKGYNLIGIGDFSSGFTSTGDQVGTTASPINPRLGSLQNNGGGTSTMALLSNSPAIDQGRSFGLTTDQRGRGRPLEKSIPDALGGDGSDIGAVELDGMIPNTLGNISTRGFVQTGNNVLIGGLIISGNGSKKVILRGLGPTLGQPPFNLPNALANPTLELRDSSGAFITSNDNWMDSPNQQAISDSGFAPPNNLESAILADLTPGSYTAIVRGVNNGTGIALVEGYDLDFSAASKFGNISTRGFVGTGNSVMIAGVISHGSSNESVIVRALGPTLSQFGVPNVLADPLLDLRDTNGNSIRTNDNWKSSQQAQIQASGYAPPNDLESAISVTLSAGNYTAILSGKSNTTGNALVEVYGLN